MFIGNVVKATEEVIYNTSTVCNSLLIINFSLYRNMVYYVHICFSNLLKELIMCKVCPFRVTDIWESSGPEEIANKEISIYFNEVLIRNRTLNHQCLGQFLRCILLLFSLGACIVLPKWSGACMHHTAHCRFALLEFAVSFLSGSFSLLR